MTGIRQMNSKKVMLINPPSGIYCRDDRCQDRTEGYLEPVYRPPMELLYQAAILKQLNTDFLVRDYSLARKSWKDLKEDIHNYKPTHVLFNITTPSLKEDLITCDIVKAVDSNIITIGRGLHFVVYNRSIFEKYPNLDVAIMGEFERSLKEFFLDHQPEKIDGIVFRKNGNIVVNPQTPYIEDLDSIPFPLREYIDNNLFTRPDTGEPEATIKVSRGCPYQCIFCLANLSSGVRIRIRTAKNVISEIEECVKKFKIRNFLLRSDLFTANRDWLYEFCSLLEEKKLNINWCCNSRVDTIDIEKLKKMEKAGCWMIGFGIESGNQEILDKIRKGITLKDAEEAIRLTKNVGIKTVTEFLIGLPWEGRKEIEDTIDFAIKIDPDFAHFSPLYPFPGTEYYNIVKKEGLLNSDDELHPYALVRPVMGTLYLTKKELEKYFLLAWKRFHLRPGYIAKTLLRAHSPRVFFSYIKYGTKFTLKLVKRGMDENDLF